MTTHLRPRRPQSDAAGSPSDRHPTFSANADVTSGIVYARGVLDVLTRELLRGTVEVLVAVGRLDVRIDLRGVRRIDRAGASLLSEISHDLADRGGSLTIVNAGPMVGHLLPTAGLPAATTAGE